MSMTTEQKRKLNVAYDFGTKRSSRSIRTGPGSRGGRLHEPEYRREYQRAWRAANPEYRERDNLRRARKRAQDRGIDPAGILVSPSFPRPLPVPAVACPCTCGCDAPVPVVACGFCLTGLHQEEATA